MQREGFSCKKLFNFFLHEFKSLVISDLHFRVRMSKKFCPICKVTLRKDTCFIRVLKKVGFSLPFFSGLREWVYFGEVRSGSWGDIRASLADTVGVVVCMHLFVIGPW